MPFEDSTLEERDALRQNVYLSALARKLRIPQKQMFEERARAEVVDILEDPDTSDDEKLQQIVALFGTRTSLDGGELRHIGKGSRGPGVRGDSRGQRAGRISKEGAAAARKRKELYRGGRVSPSSQRGAHTAAREEFHRQFRYCPECDEFMPTGRSH